MKIVCKVNIVQAVWVLLAAEIVLRVFIKIYWARRHAFRAYQVNIKTCPVNHHARNACQTQKAKMQIQQNVIIAELVKNPKLVVLNVYVFHVELGSSKSAVAAAHFAQQVGTQTN